MISGTVSYKSFHQQVFSYFREHRRVTIRDNENLIANERTEALRYLTPV